MKCILYSLVLWCLACSCHAHLESQLSKNKLHIAPHINLNDSLNHRIITTLEQFLLTKDSSLVHNEYWEKSDFQTYIFPYFDISKYRLPLLYTPTLLEIIETEQPAQKIVKLAFISHSDTTNQLAAVYNLIANDKNEKILFSNFLNYSTKNWQVLKKGSIIYKISPYKTINVEEMEEQQADIQKLCTFFEVKPIHTVFYSCRNPIELFQIRGFDYLPNMYIDKTGGIVYAGNHVFSGNNKEIYTHEIAHIYLGTCFPTIHILLNEGMATLWAGSGEHAYSWHKQIFKKYIAEHSATFHAEEYFYASDAIRAYKKTPISKMIGALICERTLRLYGKDKLFELFRQKGDIYEIISKAGLNKENLDQELQKEALQPPLSFHSKE